MRVTLWFAATHKSAYSHGESVHILEEHVCGLHVAHRLSAISDVERILVLDDGAIVEDGTPRGLLERGGMYRALFDAETGSAGATAAARVGADGRTQKRGDVHA